MGVVKNPQPDLRNRKTRGMIREVRLGRDSTVAASREGLAGRQTRGVTEVGRSVLISCGVRFSIPVNVVQAAELFLGESCAAEIEAEAAPSESASNGASFASLELRHEALRRTHSKN